MKGKKATQQWRRMIDFKLLGYVAAIFNPVPTGFLAAYCLYMHEETKKTGINVFIISTFLTMTLILSILKLFSY